MQAYIPEFILAGLAMLMLLAETFCKKTPKFVFGLIGAAGALAMLPFYMGGLYDNVYIILALVATAVTLLLSVDFRAVINLSSNDSKSQDGTGGILHPSPAGLRGHHLPVQSLQPGGTVRLPGSAYPELLHHGGLLPPEPGLHGSGHQVPDSGRRQHGFLVFGLAWYFGVTGTFIYDGAIVSHALAGQTAPAMYLALAMLLLGTAFKIGAVPMQLWIPDVYQGAPTPVTAFLSVASKVAGFALLSIILAPFAALPPVEFVIALMAAATLLVGNLGAIPQTNLKRMMGYSSIAQAGFILPLFIGTVDGRLAPNAPFYLAVYLVMTFGAFFALAMVRIQRGERGNLRLPRPGQDQSPAGAGHHHHVRLPGGRAADSRFLRQNDLLRARHQHGPVPGLDAPRHDHLRGLRLLLLLQGHPLHVLGQARRRRGPRTGSRHFRSDAGGLLHLHRAGRPDAPLPEPHPVERHFPFIIPKAVPASARDGLLHSGSAAGLCGS